MMIHRKIFRKRKDKTTICIDAGHGGSNEGTKETYDGVLIKEKDINLVIAKSFSGILNRMIILMSL